MIRVNTLALNIYTLALRIGLKDGWPDRQQPVSAAGAQMVIAGAGPIIDNYFHFIKYSNINLIYQKY